MLKFSLYWIFILLLVHNGFGQRTYQKHELKQNSLKVYTNDGVLNITPYTHNAFEVKFDPEGYDNTDTSHAVAIKPASLQTTFAEKSDYLQYGTDGNGVMVKIYKMPYKVEFYYANKKILAEEKGYFDADTLKGFKFEIAEGEKLYGAGERALPMDRKGHRLPLYNRAHYANEEFSEQMNYGMPYMMSSKKYGLLFDNAPIGFIDVGKTKANVLSFESIGGRMSYFVIGGNTFQEVVYNYTELTGRQPLPPRWALGNFASRFGYHSQKEVEAVVSEFRKQEVPLDAIILDLYWFGPDVKDYMGNLDWYTDSFPDPEQMIEGLDNKNVKTILITEPFILTSSTKWEEAVEKKVLGTDENGEPFVYEFFFGETGLVDVWKPDAKEWFWNIYKKHTSIGVAGWWGDLGEPEVHPKELIHTTGTADEVHNIYGHEWAKTIFEGYQKDFPNTRPFILMRSGYAGSQRYGLIPWSGDVNRTFGGLKAQPNLALTMGLSGMGYMHSDLGGFVNGEQKQKDVEELYVRWLQYGVFQPIYRPHAQEAIPSEVIFYEGRTAEIVKKYISLRYQLLPYNYSLAYENTTKGLPLMRPLIFIEPDNEEIQNYGETYLWGDNILVAPILDKGQTSKKLYLPKGQNWFKFSTDKLYKGGQWITEQVVLEDIPIFVRGGGFIPITPPIQSTEEYDGSNIIMHYYPDNTVRNSSYTLFDDDGKSPNSIAKKQYDLFQFDADYKKGSLKLNISKRGKSFESAPKTRKVNFVMHNWSKKPKYIKVDDVKLTNDKVVYDEGKKRLSFEITLKSSDMEIAIK